MCKKEGITYEDVYLNGCRDYVKESTKVNRVDDCHYFCHILHPLQL